MTTEDQILEFARRAAAELATEFAEDPEGELFAWLRIAQQREAMVSEAYSPTLVDTHIVRLQSDLHLADGVCDVLRASIGSVWAQETSHDQYLASVIRVIDPPDSFLNEIRDRLVRIQGRLEGSTVGGLASPSWLRRAVARIALAIGSLVQDVPEFGKEIGSLSFAPFCLLNAALEQTAVDGYKRIQSLIERVAEARFDVRVSTLAADNGRTWADERYHLGLFKLLADWIGSDPSPPPAGPSHGSVAAVARASAHRLQAASRDELIGLIVNLQARNYGKSQTFGVDEPHYEFRATDEALLRDPVVLALRARVGHQTTQLSEGAAEMYAPETSMEATAEEKLEKLAEALPKLEREA